MNSTFNLMDLSADQLRNLVRQLKQEITVMQTATDTLIKKLGSIPGIPDMAKSELQDYAAFMTNVSKQSTQEIASIVGGPLSRDERKTLN